MITGFASSAPAEAGAMPVSSVKSRGGGAACSAARISERVVELRTLPPGGAAPAGAPGPDTN